MTQANNPKAQVISEFHIVDCHNSIDGNQASFTTKHSNFIASSAGGFSQRSRSSLSGRPMTVPGMLSGKRTGARMQMLNLQKAQGL